jgi:hypothetical protein
MEKRKARNIERCRGHKSSELIRLEGISAKRRMEIT